MTTGMAATVIESAETQPERHMMATVRLLHLHRIQIQLRLENDGHDALNYWVDSRCLPPRHVGANLQL